MKKMLSILLTGVLCMAAALPALAEDVYRVGICQLVQHEALDAATAGFKDALTELLGEQVVFDEQNASGDTATCITIINTFISESADLILANATPALQSAQAATADIPILGTAVTDYASALDLSDWTGTTGMNISGTSDLTPFDQQAAMLNELFPDAKEVGLLYCSAEANSAYQAANMTEQLTALGCSCTSYTFADSNDVASVALNACTTSDVIYIPTDNTAASCAEVIRNAVEPEAVPIVTADEGTCAGCGVASLAISYYDLGYATGKMAYEVLVNGADISSMPVQTAPNAVKKYNPEMCEILNITVPEDYIVIGE